MAGEFANNRLFLGRDVLGLVGLGARLRPGRVSFKVLNELLAHVFKQLLPGYSLGLGVLVNLILVDGNERGLGLDTSGQHHVLGRDKRTILLAAEGHGIAVEFGERAARFLGRALFVDARGLDAETRAGGLPESNRGGEGESLLL